MIIVTPKHTDLGVVCPVVRHHTFSLLRSDVLFSDIVNSKYMLGFSLVYV